MSTLRRTPPKSGSQPDLPTYVDQDAHQITMRKRKQQGHEYDIKLELSEFRNDIMSLLTNFTTSQNEKFIAMREDIRSEIKDQLRVMTSLSESVLEVQSQVKTSLSEFENRITLTEKKVATMTTLSKSLDEAHETIKRLVTENDSNKQFSMMNNLEISGIPYAKGENLLTVLRNISTKVGYSLGDSDVDVIHRVRRFHSDQSETQKNNRPPAVIVRFTQRRRKNELLAAVRARRGLTTADIGLPGPAATVYVGDHLTPANKLLLKQARQLRLQHNYTFLWIRDCKIFIRKTEQNFYDGEFFDNSFDVFRSDRSAEESGAARGGGAAVATGLARAAACSLASLRAALALPQPDHARAALLQALQLQHASAMRYHTHAMRPTKGCMTTKVVRAMTHATDHGFHDKHIKNGYWYKKERKVTVVTDVSSLSLAISTSNTPQSTTSPILYLVSVVVCRVTDDLVKTASSRWMQAASDRSNWRSKKEAYVQKGS
ncbi:hypothetical protein MSG28_009023 [Choristoneura fumiferana]|uniref:Uncharacterized protein n=1 Tax=Choristoneura fumiferana TaxID=7141 RepID=A0ACC0J8V6_CHOFU|nr:hypothetical protein MSG28_009023 [Choristoneura fumiferana]